MVRPPAGYNLGIGGFPMTLTRLLGSALLVCSTAALAQTQNKADVSNSTAADAHKPVEVASAEPWRILPQPVSEQTDHERIQVDQFKIDRSGRVKLSAPNDAIALNSYDQPGDGNMCFAIRSYVVARDSKDSDSVHPVSSTTCVRAKHLELRKAHVQDLSITH